MKNNGFYNSIAYKERQSEIARKNWQMGIYDFLCKQEKRQCVNPECGKWFEAQLADPKKFCSRKCAAQINNPKRSNISNNIREKLIKLYQKGLSMQEISDKTGWNYGKVIWLMRKFNIPRRNWSDATYVKRNPDDDPFKIKNKLNEKEIELRGIGLGIYWGEGDKSPNNTSVRLGNTDPFLIKKFREFLRKIYNAKEEKFKYGLILFNDIKESDAVNFWKKHLGVERKQLGKITIIPPQGKGTYKNKSKHGVLTIIFANKKLKEQILNDIKKTYN